MGALIDMGAARRERAFRRLVELDKNIEGGVLRLLGEEGGAKMGKKTMSEQKALRLPAATMDRALALVEPVSAATLGAARWSQTAILRLAADWGLAYIEGLIERGEPLFPPSGKGKRS